MKKLALILVFALLASTANAANTPPPGVNGQIPFNNNGQWGIISTGTSSASTAQGALNALHWPLSAIGGNGGPVLNTTAPVSVPCGPSGAEQAFSSAISASGGTQTLLVPYKEGDPCGVNNQIKPSFGSYIAIQGATQTGATEWNEAGNVVPKLSINNSGIATHAPGATWWDMDGARGLVIEHQILFGDGSGGGTGGASGSAPAAIISNSVDAEGSICCAANVLDLFDASLGGNNISTAVGCPIDNSAQCINNGGIAISTTGSAGSGYVAGTYNGVPLTGGSGTTATANITIGTSGSMSSYEIWYGGLNYVVGNTVSVGTSNVGGSGSGISIGVTGIYGVGNLTGLSVTNGSSGCTNGTYDGVNLTTLTGSGSGASAHLVVSGGSVTSVSFINYGAQGYAVGNTVTANSSTIGCSGTVLTVSSIGAAHYAEANVKPRFMKTQFSGAYCDLCDNFSDEYIIGNEFTDGAIGIESVYGGGGGIISDNRFEFQTENIKLGYVNGTNNYSGITGDTLINNNNFQMFFGPDAISLGSGDQYVINGNTAYSLYNGGGFPVLRIGGPAAVTNVLAMGDAWEVGTGGVGLGSSTPYCIELTGTNDNKLFFSGTCEQATTGDVDLSYEQPSNIIVDFIDSHIERGRKFAIGVLANTNQLDVGGGVAIGTGTSYAGIGTSAGTVAPVNGMIVEGNVGIGTNVPSAPLAVVGLGTTAPIGTQAASYVCVDTQGNFYRKASCP